MIDSIPEEWDIMIIDGRFTGSSAKEEYSPKHLRDKILTYPNTSILNKTGMEHEVRNTYLENSDGYDYCLIIDSDEYIVQFDDELFYESLGELNHGLHLLEYNKGKPSHTQYGRVIVNPSEWTYINSHKFLKSRGSITQISHGDSLLRGIRMEFNEDLRPLELQNTINKYQEWLWINEGK